jgi:hypothetical protein
MCTVGRRRRLRAPQKGAFEDLTYLQELLAMQLVRRNELD